MTRVKLDLRANGTGLVELDGVDVSTAVAGVTVNANVGDMTSVLIRLPAAAVTMDGEARVKLAPQVRELLLAAGWTPPGEEPAATWHGDDCPACQAAAEAQAGGS